MNVPQQTQAHIQQVRATEANTKNNGKRKKLVPIPSPINGDMILSADMCPLVMEVDASDRYVASLLLKRKMELIDFAGGSEGEDEGPAPAEQASQDKTSPDASAVAVAAPTNVDTDTETQTQTNGDVKKRSKGRFVPVCSPEGFFMSHPDGEPVVEWIDGSEECVSSSFATEPELTAFCTQRVRR